MSLRNEIEADSGKMWVEQVEVIHNFKVERSGT